MRRSFKRRPVCVCCRGRLPNLKQHVCGHCERNHGPFSFKRMVMGSTPDWYWAEPHKADPSFLTAKAEPELV